LSDPRGFPSFRLKTQPIFRTLIKSLIGGLMRILLVFNPNAGHRRAQKLLDPVLTRFAGRDVRVELRQTERQGHATEIVAGADFGTFDGVVAAGGDGTLFETVNGFFANRSAKRVPLGVLPVGTGNAFARDMQPGSEAAPWADAVDTIAAGQTRSVDAGRFRTRDREYYFLNILGLGFVADVVKTAYALKWLGNASYTLGVLHRTAALKPFRMRITLDGRTADREAVFVEISNTRYTSNFLMAPGARVDDGLLDVTILGPLNRRRLLQCFPKIFTGEHVSLPEVEQTQARSIRIETDTPRALTPDGELIGSTPVTVECLPRAVEVFWK
jgi:diacylglycerol kinase (ATP)